MARIACLAALIAAVLAPAAEAAGPAATVRTLDRQMDRAGWASGAYVMDLDTGLTLYERAADTARTYSSIPDPV